MLQNSKEGCPAQVNTEGPTPLQLNRCPETKKYGQNERTGQSFRELNNDDIANLSDGGFKALVIKMLTDLIELGWKMKKQMKDTQSERKQNIHGTNSDKKETRAQSNNLEQKEEINIHPEQNEETRIQKSE